MTRELGHAHMAAQAVDATYVRDEALRDAKERSDDVGNLLPPTGPLLTADIVSDVCAAYRRLGAAINRLNEAYGRVGE